MRGLLVLSAIALTACVGTVQGEAVGARDGGTDPGPDGGEPFVPAEESAIDRAVVAVRLAGELVCSGVVVAPQVVVTTASCIESPLADPGALDVFVGPDLEGDGTSIGVEGGALHPSWSGDGRARDPAFDVGILRLLDPAPVEPAIVDDGSLTADVVGIAVGLVGFGLEGELGGRRGLRSRAVATVAAIGESNRVELEMPVDLYCADDPGSGLIVNRAGEERLAGISVGVGGDCVQSELQLGQYLDDFLRPAMDGVAPVEPEGPIEDEEPVEPGCGNGVCEAGEDGTSCSQDCCDDTTPCDATLRNEGVFSCRSLDRAAYDWVSDEEATALCDDSEDLCRSTSACGGVTSSCHTLPGGWAEGRCAS